LYGILCALNKLANEKWYFPARDLINEKILKLIKKADSLKKFQKRNVVKNNFQAGYFFLL
jgi:hypothetical protein